MLSHIRVQRARMLPQLLLAFFVSGAVAHNHVTVDTTAGLAGDPAIVNAGYLPSESSYTMSIERRLLHNGEPVVYELHQVATGDFAGWYTSSADLLTLTSDFFYTSGRLGLGFSFSSFTYTQPADFRFEIVGVEPVCGLQGVRYAHAAGSNRADSDAVTREGRSFSVGAGDHQHGQRMYISQRGMYDVRLRVWDASGIFATAPEEGESDIVFRVSTGHAGPGDLAEPFGTLNFFDVSAFLSLYSEGDMGVDFAAPFGQLNFFDVSAFLSAFSGGCAP